MMLQILFRQNIKYVLAIVVSLIFSFGLLVALRMFLHARFSLVLVAFFVYVFSLDPRLSLLSSFLFGLFLDSIVFSPFGLLTLLFTLGGVIALFCRFLMGRIFSTFIQSFIEASLSMGLMIAFMRLVYYLFEVEVFFWDFSLGSVGAFLAQAALLWLLLFLIGIGKKRIFRKEDFPRLSFSGTSKAWAR